MTCDSPYSYRPIGILHSPYSRRIDAPHQGTVVEGTESGEAAEPDDDRPDGGAGAGPERGRPAGPGRELTRDPEMT